MYRIASKNMHHAYLSAAQASLMKIIHQGLHHRKYLTVMDHSFSCVSVQKTLMRLIQGKKNISDQNK
jgi:hypothetical protein